MSKIYSLYCLLWIGFKLEQILMRVKKISEVEPCENSTVGDLPMDIWIELGTILGFATISMPLYKGFCWTYIRWSGGENNIMYNKLQDKASIQVAMLHRAKHTLPLYTTFPDVHEVSVTIYLSIYKLWSNSNYLDWKLLLVLLCGTGMLCLCIHHPLHQNGVQCCTTEQTSVPSFPRLPSGQTCWVQIDSHWYHHDQYVFVFVYVLGLFLCWL